MAALSELLDHGGAWHWLLSYDVSPDIPVPRHALILTLSSGSSCRCGSQFCYLCGTPYVLNYRGILAKQCHCAEWDEHRLLERAEEIDGRDHVDQVLVDDVAVANAHAERINRIMQNLRENHECDHLRWRGRPGPRECEECGDEMPLFIYECRQCNIMACRRCRYNRL